MKLTYKNVNAMPTRKMAEILAHPHAQGIDGADCGPVKEELQSELYKRQAIESERWLAQFLKEQKDQFNAMYRRKRA